MFSNLQKQQFKWRLSSAGHNLASKTYAVSNFGGGTQLLNFPDFMFVKNMCDEKLFPINRAHNVHGIFLIKSSCIPASAM